jgi:hypothetical protein
MIEDARGHDVVADFWEWYQRREARRCSPLASYALDKCEETFGRRQWDSFSYWHRIYVRERVKVPNSRLGAPGARS